MTSTPASECRRDVTAPYKEKVFPRVPPGTPPGRGYPRACLGDRHSQQSPNPPPPPQTRRNRLFSRSLRSFSPASFFWSFFLGGEKKTNNLPPSAAGPRTAPAAREGGGHARAIGAAQAAAAGDKGGGGGNDRDGHGGGGGLESCPSPPPPPVSTKGPTALSASPGGGTGWPGEGGAPCLGDRDGVSLEGGAWCHLTATALGTPARTPRPPPRASRERRDGSCSGPSASTPPPPRSSRSTGACPPVSRPVPPGHLPLPREP